MIAIIVFSSLVVIGFGWFGYQLSLIRSNILLGRNIDRTDRPAERWKTMILVALGQKKMFSRPVPALLHLALYVAFVITQIELIEIIADGFTGNHRLFRETLGGFYTFMISLIEVLSVLAFIATLAFLSRRNLLKLPRLTMAELKGWPMKDANLILIFEILLLLCIFTMNGADEALLNHQQESYGFAISQYLGPALFGGIKSMETLHVLEQIGWWGHFLMVLVFMNYLPYSKHLHIFLAFPNTYYSNLQPKGQLSNIESVTKEVRLMMDPNADPFAAAPEDEAQEPLRFGAKDVTDLSWKNLMDAYSCTECGRCTSSCPANLTGKLLSPRKIMMDTRDRMVEVGNLKRKNGDEVSDDKSLLGSYISEEELWACTSCNACVEECPVNIDPLSIIIDLRRYLVMEESKVPTELTGMLTNIENNGAPWQFSSSDRLRWAEEE
jgi:heterodisulfide reductase subunit C